MEEIAFAVVSKVYEEWEFYSDAAHAASKDELPSQASTIASFKCDYPGCTATPFETQYRLR